MQAFHKSLPARFPLPANCLLRKEAWTQKAARSHLPPDAATAGLRPQVPWKENEKNSAHPSLRRSGCPGTPPTRSASTSREGTRRAGQLRRPLFFPFVPPFLAPGPPNPASRLLAARCKRARSGRSRRQSTIPHGIGPHSQAWADFWYPRVVDLRGGPVDELGLQYLFSHLLGCSDWDRLSKALLDLDLWGAL